MRFPGTLWEISRDLHLHSGSQRETDDRAAYPKRDAIVTLQAGFTESPGCIVSLVKTLEGGSDVVVGELTEGRETMPRAVRMTRWAANVELLTLAIRHARRIDEVPLEVRYDLRNRPSRVRPMETLMGLYRMRCQSWDLSAMRGEA